MLLIRFGIAASGFQIHFKGGSFFRLFVLRDCVHSPLLDLELSFYSSILYGDIEGVYLIGIVGIAGGELIGGAVECIALWGLGFLEGVHRITLCAGILIGHKFAILDGIDLNGLSVLIQGIFRTVHFCATLAGLRIHLGDSGRPVFPDVISSGGSAIGCADGLIGRDGHGLIRHLDIGRAWVLLGQCVGAHVHICELSHALAVGGGSQVHLFADGRRSFQMELEACHGAVVDRLVHREISLQRGVGKGNRIGLSSFDGDGLGSGLYISVVCLFRYGVLHAGGEAREGDRSVRTGGLGDGIAGSGLEVEGPAGDVDAGICCFLH